MPAESISLTPTRRVRVHRRRSCLRRLRHRLMQLFAVLSICGLALDLFYPRRITHEVARALISKKGMTLSSHELQLTSRPVVTHRTLLYWSPVETVSLLHFPPSNALILAASTASRTFYPVSGNVSLTHLRHDVAPGFAIRLSDSGFHVPRFVAVAADTQFKPATLLEISNGLSIASSLHAAFVAAMAVGDPTLPAYAIAREIQQATRYAASIQVPKQLKPIVGVVVRTTRAISNLVGSIRAVADRKRLKRAYARDVAQQGRNTQAADAQTPLHPTSTECNANG